MKNGAPQLYPQYTECILIKQSLQKTWPVLPAECHPTAKQETVDKTEIFNNKKKL